MRTYLVVRTYLLVFDVMVKWLPLHLPLRHFVALKHNKWINSTALCPRRAENQMNICCDYEDLASSDVIFVRGPLFVVLAKENTVSFHVATGQ